jgi:cytochrome c5
LLTDAEALENIVRNGIRTMPAIGSHWSEEQVDALIAYLAENPPSGG